MSKYVFAALFLMTASVATAQIDCDTQMFALSTSGEIFSIDLATGNLTSLGNLPSTATEIEASGGASDLVWADSSINSDDTWTADPTNGFAVINTFTGPTGALTGLEFANGILYGTRSTSAMGGSTLGTVNTTTGAFTAIGATGRNEPISGLAYDTNTGTMYGVTAGGGVADLVTLDLVTGTATIVESTGTTFIGSIEFAPNGTLYGVTTSSANNNSQSLITIDTTTAVVTGVGFSGASMSGLTSCVPPLFADGFESGDTSAWSQTVD
ncbi:MAG: hypothetical protein AAGD38_21605 [Acidobacteriota bacterium]